MIELKVKGMSCAHCQASVKKELEANKATNVNVDLEKALVTFEGELTKEKAKELIQDLGFTVE